MHIKYLQARQPMCLVKSIVGLHVSYCHPPLYSSEAGPLTEPKATQVARQLQSSFSTHNNPMAAGTLTPYWALYMGSGCLNGGPHARPNKHASLLHHLPKPSWIF